MKISINVEANSDTAKNIARWWIQFDLSFVHFEYGRDLHSAFPLHGSSGIVRPYCTFCIYALPMLHEFHYITLKIQPYKYS